MVHHDVPKQLTLSATHTRMQQCVLDIDPQDATAVEGFCNAHRQSVNNN